MNRQDYNRVLSRVHIRAQCRAELMAAAAAGKKPRRTRAGFAFDEMMPRLAGAAACLMLLVCGGILYSGLREGGLSVPASSAAESNTETALQTTTTEQTQTVAYPVQVAEVTADVTETAALTLQSSTVYTADTVQTTASTTAVTTAPPAEETTAPETTVTVQQAESRSKIFGGYIPMHMSQSDYQEYEKALKTELFGNPNLQIGTLPEAEQYRYYEELRTRTGDYQIDNNPVTLAQPLAFWIAEKGIPIEQGYALLDLVSAGDRLPETLRTEIEQTYYEPKGETEEAFRNSMRSMASILKELGEYAASLMEQDNPEEGVDWCTQYYFIYPDPLEKTVQKEELS